MPNFSVVRRITVAVVLFLLSAMVINGAPARSATAAQPAAVPRPSLRANVTPMASPSPVPSPSPSPTAQPETCSVKVTKIERVDPYHKNARAEINDGAKLKVVPLYELVKLKFTLEVNIPEKDFVTFGDQARFNNAVPPKRDWINVELKSSSFDPQQILGKKAGVQEVNYEFKLPADVHVDREAKSLVGKTVELTLTWKCKSGASGLLAKLNLEGKKAQFGKIDGTVTDGSGQGLFQCRIELDPPATTGRVVTGRDGEYLIENLLPGDYTVTATGKCGGQQTHKPQSKPASVVADKTTTVNFELKP
jgi:hypothetical protein